ncbi:redoxin domain-containing protein [Natronorubrum aibiense]|uniref:Redoxin domain-containing protein n=1 Tax=Natronorubrum aibiense TaxID=348826 RepID=A0A5P9P956_9EURY|nr:redoxin domain-containing protein [Natronorubrum aibiense]QFU84691.1 redoxin domain-containing protein [Natronorubrum aibiense]
MSTDSGAGDEDAAITLYRLHGCPYCERIVRRLERYGIPYRSRFVAGEHSRRDAVAREAGTRSVPVVVDHERGVTMPESSRILEYLERTYGDGGPTERSDSDGMELIEFPPAEHPTVGETAPEFTRPLVSAAYWEDTSLSTLVEREGPVLLVFYPLNWGGKSVYWWGEIRDRSWHEDLTVVGVGIGQPFDHQRFIERHGLENALYSDPGNGVAERYGVVHDLDGMTGVSEPRPATFLIGPERTIDHVWIADEWPPSPPYDEIESNWK